MKTEIRVTVGMCVRNVETSIKEAIESVLNQDFPHGFMELIVVDGYSTDNTMQIIKEYLDKMDVKKKIFSENEGLGRARQIVVDNAQGEYIVWVDGDMMLSEDFIKRQVEFMDENLHVAIAKGTYELSHGPNLLSTLEIYSRASDKITDYGSKKTFDKSLGTSGCIYRVDAIRQVGGFDQNIRGYGEDWDAEYRTRVAGWSLCTIQVRYRDYERFGLTWKELWRRYWRRGYDLHFFFQKHKVVFKLYKMLPPAVAFSGLLKSLTLYRLTRQGFVFLLPIQYMLKMTAWWFGYVEGRSELYET